MTKREIAALACKILALYAVTLAWGAIGSIIPFLLYRVEPSQGMSLTGITIANISYTVLMGTTAFLLWFKADRIAISMVRDEGMAIENSKIHSSDIKAIAFSVVGLFILAETIPHAVGVIVERSMSTPMPGMDMGWNAGKKALVARLVVEIAIGFWLLLGSRGLVGLLKLSRESGSNKIKE